MTSVSKPIGDDDLQAYVDDRISATRRRDIESYLGEHPKISARVVAERQQRAALKARLEAKFVEPIPARLRITNIRAAQRTKFTQKLRTAAAAVLLVTTGAAGGYLVRDRYPRGEIALAATPATTLVSEDAVKAYRTFVVEVAHPVEVRAGDEAHLVQWLSKRLGRTLKTPDLSKFGFRLMGGRVLPAESSAAAMLMYDNDHGTRLTVYVRSGDGSETAFRFLKDGEVSTFAWIDQGFGFAVSAATDREVLLPIAEAVYRDLDAATHQPPTRG